MRVLGLLFTIFAGLAAAANTTVIIKYKDVGLSVNSTTDSSTLFPPPPPGVHSVADLPYLGYQIFELDDKTESAADYCAELEQDDSNVEFCEADSEVSLISEQSATPNDPLYSQQYNIPIIDLPAVWKEPVFGSTNVSVCFPDTGSSPDHPDIKGSIKNGTSFLAGVQSPSYTDGNAHGRQPVFLYTGAIIQTLILIALWV